jgi:SPP1 family predicted phage head-tail adaptor
MINPAKYRNRIEIGKHETRRNPETNRPETIFVPYHKCRAAIVEPTNWQSFNASIQGAQSTIFFEFRYKQGIQAGMLVSYKDALYEIKDVKPDLQRKRETVVECRELVANE